MELEGIAKRIFVIRGRRVMLDSDLALLYGVATARVNQQVRRNIARFPDDFMFELTQQEFRDLILHSATSKKGSGGRRKLPLAFTQEGVSMLSSVLQSPLAVDVHVAIMRAFVRMREVVSAHSELKEKLHELEGKIETHDRGIRRLFEAIEGLLAHPEPARPPIGFDPTR